MATESIIVLLVELDPETRTGLLEALAEHPVETLIANDTEHALQQVSENEVQIVVLDQRQDEAGALARLQLLQQQQPGIEGFLLTVDCQYEPEGKVAADGLVHHYIEYPSDQQILGYRLRQALRVARLKQELQDVRSDLHHDLDTQRNQFVRQQKRLISRVQSSEAQAHLSSKQLQETSQILADGYRQMVRMLSNIALRRMGRKASGQNQQLNQLASRLAEKCQLSDTDQKHLVMAWMLRNVGKLSFNDHLLVTPYLSLSPQDQREYHRHPDNAYAVMAIVRPLDRAATLVRQHKEYLDGSGYPLGLEALQIDRAAQVLTVLNDYTELTVGHYSDRALSTTEALEYLRNKAAERYNQDIVNGLEQALEELAPVTDLYQDQLLNSIDLRPGMVLTRDLISSDGILLLGNGEVLDQETIDRIRDLEFNLSEFFHLYVENR